MNYGEITVEDLSNCAYADNAFSFLPGNVQQVVGCEIDYFDIQSVHGAAGKLSYLRLSSLAELQSFLCGLLKYAAIACGSVDAYDFAALEITDTGATNKRKRFAHRLKQSFLIECTNLYLNDNFERYMPVYFSEKLVTDLSEIAEIKRHLSASIVLSIINGDIHIPVSSVSPNYHNMPAYQYSDDGGFSKTRQLDFTHDFDILIYDFAVESIIHNKVVLCPICGTPVVTSESHGNEAEYCSRACITKASSVRRSRAMTLAASCVPIEEAINIIGKRYEDSVIRWYSETASLTNPTH